MNVNITESHVMHKNILHKTWTIKILRISRRAKVRRGAADGKFEHDTYV